MLNLFKFLGGGSYKDAYTSGKSNRKVTTATNSNIAQEWANISVLLQGGQPSQLRQALIAADKSLDNALRDKVRGETMGERLKNSSKMFDRGLYDKIWKAHKMRNALVHESGYEPPHHMITRGIEDLRKALNVLGVKV